MSATELNIKCNNIKTNFNDSGMTSGEFWDAFAAYSREKAEGITSKRFNRYGKISDVIGVVSSLVTIVGTFSVLIMAAIH